MIKWRVRLVTVDHDRDIKDYEIRAILGNRYVTAYIVGELGPKLIEASRPLRKILKARLLSSEENR